MASALRRACADGHDLAAREDMALASLCGGLALANSLATALEALGLLVLMRRRLEGLPLGALAKGALQAAAAALAMGLAVWGWMRLVPGSSAWLVAGGGVALGGFVPFGGMATNEVLPTLSGFAMYETPDFFAEARYSFGIGSS